MTMARDHLSKADSVTVAAIEAAVLALVEARELVARFHTMIRTKTEAALDPWIAEARASLLSSFAEGIAKSEAAVRAAITQPWSNGQTEGQVNRLKMTEGYLASGALVALMARYPLTEGGIFLIRPPGQNPARKIRVLAELLIEHFG
jgi:hypothetical protein